MNLSSDRTRALALALMLLLPLAAACGGAAEEPAPAPAAEEPAPAPEPEAAPAPMEEPAEAAPEEPQIVGNIILSGEDFDWGTPEGETQPYTWTARVQNDTTSTLSITVRFQFLDETDTVLKTETATIELAPAASRSISQNGTMSYDEALKVVGFLADYDYKR
jgi:hypothetical protein